MDDAKVMKLWRQAGLPEYFLGNGGTNVHLVEFARLCAAEAVADERERCAKVCDDLRAPIPMSETVGAANRALREAAAAIRRAPGE
jgi:hypothetical protein